MRLCAWRSSSVGGLECSGHEPPFSFCFESDFSSISYQKCLRLQVIQRTVASMLLIFPCIRLDCLQSRCLYGRHVSSFLDPVFGAMMKQALSPNTKVLDLVGVRLELLNFLTPVCVDSLFRLLAFGAGCLFWTDVAAKLLGSGLVGCAWAKKVCFLLIRIPTVNFF